ncbi:tyrosine--tRNA ligase [Chengkuizengella axinellae]|uniref:Tyrosine--tRNA ligase n=1 Tax=Chengkuizengella axinellae TaxID=3064388 RepID=A0ABT9IVE2_9BACL|nr:tyrosine--tRNA ligase [Chengkuizengella sp. 2205SS18-9]MDP5273323.1 tyrosine--tRNA ligase [Chengkuizengella sp. 2205SS18-9]
MAKWEELSLEQQTEVTRQIEVIRRGVVEIVPEDELKQKIIKSVVNKKPLKVKLGVDPSAPDIHIGHTVVLHKLRQFQELGHTIQLIIGDFTGRIGDPTGKSETRKQLTEEDVLKNAQSYKEQFVKVLDPDKIDVYFNSEWLSPLNFADVVELSAKVTVARMLERDDFTKRYNSGQSISIHEFFYPLMQGYDSVALQSDIEIGGTDQKFNLLMGRTLQKEYGVQTQATVMLPLIEGLDGVKKMSKSLNNYIGINEEPSEIYGKSMSIPDELMVKYYELATDISLEALDKLKKGLESGEVHPRDAKMQLAHTFVRMYYGKEQADQAEERFKTVFQKRALPEDIPTIDISTEELDNGALRLINLLVLLKLQSSNGEARRSITQGAVRINEEKITDVNAVITPNDGDIVQVGKRKFAKISL